MLQSRANVTPSVSLLMGVCNGQTWLDRAVKEAVEVLSELGGKFEIGVIDQGSSDDTADIAATLATVYPQVYYAGSMQSAPDSAVMQAACQTTGEVVVLRPASSVASLRDIDRLRRGLKLHDLVFGQVVQPASGPSNWKRRLARSLGSATTASPAIDLCLTSRRVLEQLEVDELTRENLVAAASGAGVSWTAVEIAPFERGDLDVLGSRAISAGQFSRRRVHAASQSARVARPKFLNQMGRLVRGE
ncbi:MAG: glycosyltransferase [Pirellulales bacterium]